MKAPAHLHLAVRILDRVGVDEAVVGDLLEVYEARPSGLRVWREVAGALLAHVARHVRDNKPQTIRRLGTAAAALGLLVIGPPLVLVVASTRLLSARSGAVVGMGRL